MQFSLLNLNLVTISSTFILLLSILFIYYSYKKRMLDNLRFKILFRFIAFFVISFFLFQPILKVKKYNSDKKKMNIYIDNSASMINNISIDSLNAILKKIIDKSNNDFSINKYLFGDNIRPLLEDITLSDTITNFKRLNDYIISNNADQNLLISDGLNYLNRNNYNSYHPINTIGIGLLDSIAKVSVADAKIENNLLTYRVDWMNMKLDSIDLFLRNSKSLIRNKKIHLKNQSGSYLDTLKIGGNIFNNYTDITLDIDIDFDDNVFDNYANVFIDEYKDKNISLITGIPSLNTRFIKQKLQSFNKNIFHLFLDDSIDINYSDLQLLVFDNYPANAKQFREFNSIARKLNDNKIPFVMIMGPNQDFEIVNRISDNFNFSVTKEINENLVFQHNDLYSSYISSYSIPPTSYYKISTTNNNKKNIYYSNGSPAVLFENLSMFIFCPNLSSISYKLTNDSDSFNNLFEILFKEAYYQNNQTRIFVDRNKFFNNEEIDLDLIDNSKIIYTDLILKIKDGKDSLYAQYAIGPDNFSQFTIPAITIPGTYNIYLLNKNKKNSNKLIIEIFKHDNESTLSGQNINYLNKISSQTNGIYSDEGNYLDNLASNSMSYKVESTNNIYDSKDYLIALLIAMLAMVIDWYLRKKRGLL